MAKARETDLRSLKDHPFDLLREIERRSKAAVAGASGEAGAVEEWVGIAFRLGDEQFIVARDRVREVLMVPPFIKSGERIIVDTAEITYVKRAD